MRMPCLCACVVAAASAGAAAGELPAKRDLFGTARRGSGPSTRSSDRVWGTVEISDGTSVEGWLSLARGRPLEVFDLEAKEWREFDMGRIASLSATPRKEELEREWRWKEYGRDEKVFTGRSYPKRWLEHDLALRPEITNDGRGEKGDEDGERVACHIKGAVLYLTTEPGEKAGGALPDRESRDGGVDHAEKESTASPSREETKARPVEPPKRLRFVLRQYERGKLGQSLDDLVYVKRVTAHEKRTEAPPPAAAERASSKVPRSPAPTKRTQPDTE